MHAALAGRNLPRARARGGVTLLPPANNTRAIEGHYMLFLLSSAGVPSVARWVRLP
ncbi:MAG: DUF1929 domain-containing protein [Planctomycetes bacterium]|nr:DUF1929 domain-containing protein [Planctomycetota bacterium]